MQIILSRPGWSGYMSRMHSITSAYSKSAVLPLQFVNMDPQNQSTMYICILYAAEQRNKRIWSCIAITVDQPLLQRQEKWFWLRAHVVISCIVIRLGGFHHLVLSVPLWPERVPMHLACARPLVIWTETRLNRVLFTWWMDVHVLKAFAYICYQGGHCHGNIITGVDDNLKKCTSVLLIVAIDWERHAPLIWSNCGFSTSSV